MGKINARLRSVEGSHFGFWCPGCHELHLVFTSWTFNGDFDRPTVTPSVLMRSGHYAPQHKPGDQCWCTWNAEHPQRHSPFACGVCHYFVTDGNIVYCGDCTHALAGKTVPIPELPDGYDT